MLYFSLWKYSHVINTAMCDWSYYVSSSLILVLKQYSISLQSWIHSTMSSLYRRNWMYTFSVNPEEWSFMLVWAWYFQWVGIKCVLFHFVFLLWEPKIIAYMFSWFSRQDNHTVYINQHHDHLRLHKLPTFLPSTHLLTHPHIPFLMQPNISFTQNHRYKELWAIP